MEKKKINRKTYWCVTVVCSIPRRDWYPVGEVGLEVKDGERGVIRNKGMEQWGWSDTSPQRVRVRWQINRDGSARSCTTEISRVVQRAPIRDQW